MKMIAQKAEKVQMASKISCFMKEFRVGDLLNVCNAYKEKGVSVVKLFMYMLQMVFADRSMYQQMRTGRWVETFSKNTYYRFLNSAKVNWERFNALLAARVIHDAVDPLTSEDRKDVFIVDDTLYRRRGYKKTELCAAVFDHVDMKSRTGFRALTLGWSDGNTFIPIGHRLLSSTKDDKVLGPQKQVDRRTLAGRRRSQARRKATEVMVELLVSALKAGIKAKYVLFDSWFCEPKQILCLKKMGLDTIGMVKKSGNTNYYWNGERLNVKQIYSRNRKRPGRSKYLLSIELELGGRTAKEPRIPARLVYVRNRAKKKDWLAIICTDMTLSEDEIIRIYGKRWDIEVFFKTCKSYLKLLTECHSLSYDALTAHTTVVFVRYILLALEQRSATDQRTFGDLFLMMVDELADISFSQSLCLILEAMLESICEVFQASEEQCSRLMEAFISRLPQHFRALLGAD